ncbi:MAG: GNAT family N-acetyltransferase, partial [Clostridia bacterium]|nr:GNAT family N-acetyltransferase [Clostridia bacterium]
MRPFIDSDMELFQTWLQKPYIAKYYHDPEDWIDELEKRHTEFQWIEHRIVELAGKPIGFCQYYSYELSIPYGEDWHGSIPPQQTYSLDYMIGEEDCVGKGYGKQSALQLIELIRLTGDAKRIIVNPEKENLPSCNTL